VAVVLVMHGYLAFSLLGPQTVAVTSHAEHTPACDRLAWYLVGPIWRGGLVLIGLWTLGGAGQRPAAGVGRGLLHLDQGFFMKVIEIAPGRHVVGGYEFSLTVLVATIALVVLGSGAASVDSTRR
jgi:uncharacterized membrane protein YphA (DoxX/SURF4 family)